MFVTSQKKMGIGNPHFLLTSNKHKAIRFAQYLKQICQPNVKGSWKHWHPSTVTIWRGWYKINKKKFIESLNKWSKEISCYYLIAVEFPTHKCFILTNIPTYFLEIGWSDNDVKVCYEFLSTIFLTMFKNL